MGATCKLPSKKDSLAQSRLSSPAVCPPALPSRVDSLEPSLPRVDSLSTMSDEEVAADEPPTAATPEDEMGHGGGAAGPRHLAGEEQEQAQEDGGGPTDDREGEEEIGGPDAKLFVGGLAWEIDNEALMREFERYGEVIGRDTKVMMKHTDGGAPKSRGFGFVQMGRRSEADRAIAELHGTTDGALGVQGKTISVKFAQPLDQNSQQGRRDGGRGGDYGRDRRNIGDYGRSRMPERHYQGGRGGGDGWRGGPRDGPGGDPRGGGAHYRDEYPRDGLGRGPPPSREQPPRDGGGGGGGGGYAYGGYSRGGGGSGSSPGGGSSRGRDPPHSERPRPYNDGPRDTYRGGGEGGYKQPDAQQYRSPNGGYGGGSSQPGAYSSSQRRDRLPDDGPPSRGYGYDGGGGPPYSYNDARGGDSYRRDEPSSRYGGDQRGGGPAPDSRGYGGGGTDNGGYSGGRGRYDEPAPSERGVSYSDSRPRDSYRDGPASSRDGGIGGGGGGERGLGPAQSSSHNRSYGGADGGYGGGDRCAHTRAHA
jgi:hypothetical protein